MLCWLHEDKPVSASLTQSIQSLSRELAALAESGPVNQVAHMPDESNIIVHLSIKKLKEANPHVADDLSTISFTAKENSWRVFSVVGKRIYTARYR
jgi:hypothetical protein